MIAAEAKSAILKPLLSMGMNAITGGLGGLFGSASTSAGTGLMSSASMPDNMHMTSSLSNMKFADGGVPEGHGISAYSGTIDRKSTRLNSSHLGNSYAVFCLKKKTD